MPMQEKYEGPRRYASEALSRTPIGQGRRGISSWSVIVLLVAAIGAWWLLAGPKVDIVISQGQTTKDVANLLRDNGVIRFPIVFRVLAKTVRYDKNIQAGTYHVRRRMSSALALWRLTHSRPDLVRIVIPEGFSARQIAERLEANGIASADEFASYAKENRLEGYLFPATYQFMPNTPVDVAARRMRQEFIRNVGPEFSKHSITRLSKERVVILASIVQREAVLPQEQPMIAAVCLNRLTKRMRLEVDPTVQYALGSWKKGLSLQDLRIDSPYNTYIHYGLPPTPICSPGLNAIRAVLSPAETDALYFVADNTGGHTFSDTFEEHLKAKHKAKRERRLKKAQEQ